jgi:hypothetical protein
MGAPPRRVELVGSICSFCRAARPCVLSLKEEAGICSGCVAALAAALAVELIPPEAKAQIRALAAAAARRRLAERIAQALAAWGWLQGDGGPWPVVTVAQIAEVILLTLEREAGQ